MRKISKTYPKKKFQDWVKKNKDLPENFNYDSIQTDAKQELKETLLEEQGFLCAYTGCRILDTTSHIEHIKPQNKCEYGEDVDYRNLIACFPDDGGDKSYGFGAPLKAGWWNKDQFISPTAADCETHFTFTWSGKIKAFPDDHAAAQKTIEILGLNHSNLIKLRRAAIKKSIGLGASDKPLTTEKAEKLLRFIDKSNSKKQLEAFCFVIKYFLKRVVA